MNQPFSREELYEHVWSKPVTKLVAELSLSYWDIKQWCSKLEVPLPPQGYWSRIQYGKPVERIALPPVSETFTEPKLVESRQIHEPPILFPGEKELSFLYLIGWLILLS